MKLMMKILFSFSSTHSSKMGQSAYMVFQWLSSNDDGWVDKHASGFLHIFSLSLSFFVHHQLIPLFSAPCFCLGPIASHVLFAESSLQAAHPDILWLSKYKVSSILLPFIQFKFFFRPEFTEDDSKAFIYECL